MAIIFREIPELTGLQAVRFADPEFGEKWPSEDPAKSFIEATIPHNSEFCYPPSGDIQKESCDGLIRIHHSRARIEDQSGICSKCRQEVVINMAALRLYENPEEYIQTLQQTLNSKNQT